ncbi:glucan 1,3-beta-glucosidase [Colletotrichum plurivorum]|uniref:Glucan 1,3-beta-glucosidase n=1 Tax=Colletotrichum plurivorum TaxID=2175906 RepID=A0A8H6JJ94_9PEZI|nr:glucan 1,3-beta-glucosidase [Colletotrichum plurivorum]
MRFALALFAVLPAALAGVTVPVDPVGTVPPLPVGPPQPAPTYAKNNVNNQEGVAPDKGVLDGPVLGVLEADVLADIHRNAPPSQRNGSIPGQPASQLEERQSSGYWLSTLGNAGKMPFAPSGYQFYRNVKDFGAVGDGVADDTAAINRAAAVMSKTDLGKTRCAADCGSITTLGALVYFPPGTYKISSPIIQYYFTQFVGDPTSKPIIKGSANFSGIALFDNNFYIPGGNGHQWYINQSNFLRQIRNFVFDLTGMARENTQGDQTYVPTGIHWQVGQATSITNCDFKMAVSDAKGSATAVGIMMENGSGGVVSDLTFFGGNIGFLAGSQQFTATNLQFTSCLTAIKQIWNWGFTWKNIYVLSCYIAIDCTEYSSATRQGTGSITVLDSHFNGVPYGITLGRLASDQPNVVLDNLLVENSESVVMISGGETLLPGSGGALFLNNWVSGQQYLPSGSGKKSGFANPAVKKPQGLLDATANGVANDGTGDQTNAINSLLSSKKGSVIFFPAGVYMVKGTVKIPVGSKIVGSMWSQIMGTGSYFQDEANPKVMVQVGNKGDSGVIEISDMMFTVKGPTAGCILMQWNVHESSQGSAAMWDSHFRVGGAAGTDLQLKDCPSLATSVNSKCKAAAILMQVTHDASGYFDNVWLWVADHDLDNPLNADAYESEEGIPLNVKTQISIYVGRGLLVESQGPTWFYGSSSEHTQMYQYELYGASNIFMGHMQTETPYYQPNPNALTPYKAGSGGFPGDPTFDDCFDDLCRSAWALRVINSTDIVIYSAGFYSFFKNNQLGCTANENCQLAMIETSYTEALWIYNIFTKGNIEIVSPKGGLLPVLFNDTTRNGYTSEIAAWLELANGGREMGSNPDPSGAGGSGDVYIDPAIWRSPSNSRSIGCQPPCTYILPPIVLPSPTTITFSPSTTSLEVGWFTTTSFRGHDGKTTTTSIYVSVVVTSTLTIPKLTTATIPLSNVPIPPGVNKTVIYPKTSLLPPTFIITDDRVVNGTTRPLNTRTITPKPWPWTNTIVSTTSKTAVAPIVVTHTRGPLRPRCTGNCGQKCKKFCSWPCEDGACDGGKDCKDDNCTKGGSCSGSNCDKGGDCEGPRCTKGGDCTGPTCTRGGSCKGPLCERGGDCFGILCVRGGGCEGPLCFRGGNCGPLGCITGTCVGARCGKEQQGTDHKDSNDPNAPPDDGEEDCTTETFSSCRTYCTVSPKSTCTSTCSKVIGCDTTGTSIASTVTLPPTYVARPSPWDRGPGADLGEVASSLLVDFSANGFFGTAGGGGSVPGPTVKPTSTVGGGGGGSPPAPSPTAKLHIVLGETFSLGATLPAYDWWFYAKAWGADYNFCYDSDITFSAGDNVDTKNIPYPNGTFKIPKMLSVEGCEYKGTASAPGTLTCPDLKDPVKCSGFTPSPNGPFCQADNAPTTFFYRVECKWGSAAGRVGSPGALPEEGYGGEGKP